MSDLNDLVDEVGRLTEATTELIDTTNISKKSLDEAVTSASTDAARAETAESKATPAATKAEAAQGAAEKARDDAEAIVYEGDASLEPKPGSIPIADSEAKLNYGWLPDQSIPHPDFWMPLSSNLKLWEGFGEATFTRSSKATYINKSGVLTEAEENEPRFEKEGVLIEGSSTNFYINSDSPDNWVNTNCDLIIDQETPSISGKASVKAVCNSVSAVAIHQTNSIYSVSEGDKVTQSVYFKSAQVGEFISIGLRLRFSDSDGVFAGSRYLYIDGRNDTGDEWVTGNVTNAGNGWFKLTATTTISSSHEGDTFRAQFYMLIDGFSVEETPIGGTCFVCFPQVELLPFASSYIPTEGEPVTRADDYLTSEIEGNIPINSDKTYVIEIDTGGIKFPHGSGTASSRRHIYTIGNKQDTINGYQACFAYPDSSSTKNNISIFDSENSNILMSNPQENNKLLIVYRRKNDIGSLFVNSIKDKNIEWGGNNIPVDIITLGALVNNNRILYGHIKDFKIWHKALSDEQIAALGKA